MRTWIISLVTRINDHMSEYGELHVVAPSIAQALMAAHSLVSPNACMNGIIEKHDDTAD